MELTSPAFTPGGAIPSKYTCEGEDISVPLEWTGVPENAQSLALVSDDPDAPGHGWVHWVLYDLPADIQGLPEGIAKTADGPEGSQQGMTDFGRVGYGGPCPPSGTHRYFFRLYALDRPTGLGPGANKEQLLGAIQGHVLAQAELMGMYKKISG